MEEDCAFSHKASLHSTNRSHEMTATALRLEAFPWDIIEEIARRLRQSDLVRLCRTSKALYQLSQPLLWRHPRLSGHGPLTLFSNFLNRPPVLTVPRLDDWDRVCWDRCAQVTQMMLRLDPGTGLNELASEILSKIAKFCPHVTIKLLFNGKIAPRYLLEDPHIFFPGVTRLVILRKGAAPDPRDMTLGVSRARVRAVASTLQLDEDMVQVTEEMTQEVEDAQMQESSKKRVHPCLTLIPPDEKCGSQGVVAYDIERLAAPGLGRCIGKAAEPIDEELALDKSEET